MSLGALSFGTLGKCVQGWNLIVRTAHTEASAILYTRRID